MKVERSIGAPLRSAKQTVDDLAKFVGDVLAARTYPAASAVGAQVQRLSSLFNMLLTKRTFASPALVLRTADMEIRLHIAYEIGANEDLSVPMMTLLGELDPKAFVEVVLFTTEKVPPDFRRLVAFASDGPARIVLMLGETADAAPEEVEVPGDAEETKPTDEVREDADPDLTKLRQ